MNVLIIDDNAALAGGLKTYLESNGLRVQQIVKSLYAEAASEACSLLRAVHHEDDMYQALVLDVDFKDHTLGGIKIYAKILREGLRGKFRHILIWTRYAPVGRTAQSDEFRAVDIFRELTFVPPQNVFPKDRSDQGRIVERIRELAKEKSTPIGTFGMWSFH